jgi:cobalt-precorrin-7 (C5)-methyltransferase
MVTGGKLITIIGCGPGSVDCLTGEAIRAIESAEVLVGAKRLLDMFPDGAAERIEAGAYVDRALDEIGALHISKKVAVLVTGDPGVCSLAQPIIRQFGRQACRIIPGISSVQVAFARVGIDWYGAKLISIHGREPDTSIESLAAEHKIAVLTEGSASLPWIAELAAGMTDARVFLCEDLTLETERVREVNMSALRSEQISSRTIALLIKGTAIK